MIALIGIIFLIYWVNERFGMKTAVIVFFVVGGILLIAFCKAWSDGDKAYLNVMRYWKKGGPEREEEERTERRKQETVTRVQDPDGPTLYQQKCAELEREALERQRKAREGQVPVATVPEGGQQAKEELFVCPVCGRYVRTQSERAVVNGQLMREYYCPRCRKKIITGI